MIVQMLFSYKQDAATRLNDRSNAFILQTGRRYAAQWSFKCFYPTNRTPLRGLILW